VSRLEERVVVLAPSANDGPVTARVLAKAGMDCVLASDGADLCRVLGEGAAAALLSEEALDDTTTRALGELLRTQPPWSDLPVLILTTAALRARRLTTAESLEPLGNVTLLDRPLEVITLVSAVRAALRARRRQYAARTAMAEIEAAQARLRESDRKEAERHAALVRRLVDNLPELAWTAQADGHIDFYNRRWFEYTGTTLEEMQGWGWEKVHHPDVLPQVLERWKHALCTGEPFEMEFPLRRRDGTFHWFLTRIVPMRDAEGRIERWMGANTDIDELRRSREELRRISERLGEALGRFQALFAQSHVSKVLIDGTRRIVDANDAFARMLGYARSELLGRSIDDLTHPDDCHGNVVEVTEIQTSGHADRRKRFVRRDGRVVWVDLHATAVREGAAILGLKEMVDISQQLEAERMLERSRADAERAAKFAELFVGVLGHDLRNPLSAIKMGGEIFAKTAKDDRERRTADRVLTSARRMARMIDQILDFTRIRAGTGLPYSPSPIDLCDVIDRVAHELECAGAEDRVRIHAEGHAGGSWDPDRLAQVFSNLLANALEHSPPEAIVRVSIDARDSDRVVVMVQNPGTIPAELIPTVFEPFKQAHRHARSQGLGLGLYITKEIVSAHGGSIDVSSTQDSGTQFRVVLPRNAKLVRPFQ
jgi:PAS domain S-box-containing protein